jgi:predicted porin
MKKSALALAVAAALVGFGSAANADTTLYGSARVSVDWVDNNIGPDSNFSLTPGGIGSYGTPGSDGVWDVYNNSSRLGVRGEEDLGGGLAAIYQYEFGVDITEGGNLNSNRPKWVGLKGNSWGSITLGTQWTPYYNVMGVADIFNSNRPFSNSTVYLGNQFGTRMDNSVVYSTPNWSGFSAQAMLVMNGTGSAGDKLSTSCVDISNCPRSLSDGVDLWNIAATYKNGPFFIGATYLALNGDSFDTVFNTNPVTFIDRTRPAFDGDQWGVALGYNQGPFALTLNYENGDANNAYFGTVQNIYGTAQYTFGNNVIRAAYGYMSPDSAVYLQNVANANTVRFEQQDINNYILGYQYNFSKRTRVFAEYIGQDLNNNGDVNIVSMGTRVDF